MMDSPASLFMYAMPEMEVALTRWWAGLARHLEMAGLTGVPDKLSWPEDPWAHWRDPNLLLAQTCGYPFATLLRDRVAYVVTPRYAAEGCEGPLYRSRLLARAGDRRATQGDGQQSRAILNFRGARLAFNEERSLSGYQCVRWAVADHAPGAAPFFAEEVETGAHRRSLAAVRDGGADLCAVDAVTFALIARHAPAEVSGLATVGWTRAVPGLPLVTSGNMEGGRIAGLRAAVEAALADPDLAAAREALLLSGASVVDQDDYRRIASYSGTADERLPNGLSDSRQSLANL
ncbi:PhnD/SsuA/transferrin family substrate-binding protein [Marivibrio halodurans]|uniref:PhnD/SsuA/transferrin family substrate-binding protein n=1 Tax=Marivibrio halodurans TaxID=2039722 RepID=A0A8J7RZ48_9PROT|nr:PhnD/SsuA/transferrin family substrate-binding protein [Marivibrio halodurans]MBP5855734.1 PhnD/SsuA/transferrin family substrate-binding protein [Marivibrio halodurans]